MVLLSKMDGILSKWSGGASMQLMIAPRGSLYSERDFDFRISYATIENDYSEFTSLPDYDRSLVALSPKVCLKNDGQDVRLEQYDIYRFDGASRVESFGMAKDFGVMCRKGVCRAEISLKAIRVGEALASQPDTYIYCNDDKLYSEPSSGKIICTGDTTAIIVKIIYLLKIVMPNEGHEDIWNKSVEMVKNAEESMSVYGILGKHESYKDFLDEAVRLNEMEQPVFDMGRGYTVVPCATYFLTDLNEKEILGILGIRKMLTPQLRNRGGNIGYSMMPACRRRGYATKMLSLGLEECRKLGMFAVMLTCDSENTASKKVITSNDGVLYGTGNENGVEFEKYYIIL